MAIGRPMIDLDLVASAASPVLIMSDPCSNVSNNYYFSVLPTGLRLLLGIALPWFWRNLP